MEAKNPFFVLLKTPTMLGCYLLIIMANIFRFDTSLAQLAIFDLVIFLLFYGFTAVGALHYIYTALKYKDILILTENRIVSNGKLYNDISTKSQEYCRGGLCNSYINFYSKEKLVARYYLNVYSYRLSELTQVLIEKILNQLQNS